MSEEKVSIPAPVKKLPRYSYSRLNTYESCPYKYKLTYEDKHYIHDDNLANELGTLMHWIEEHIALNIINNETINYDEYRKNFLDINIPKLSPTDTDGGIYGVNILKEKYREEFYQMDDNGVSYFTKCNDYYNTGIYRLEKYMNSHPELEIVDVEKYFEVVYGNYIFYGYIDRIMRNVNTGQIIIEDIKTKDKPFDKTHLTTPLQFVIYSMALKSAYHLEDYPTLCYYDLPNCDLRQQAGTSGFINRGLKKLDKIIKSIEGKEWDPSPSPLCHWCPFCYHNPKQPEEGKGYCCYYSLWTPKGTAKSWEVMNKWEGVDKHSIIMERFLKEQQGPGKNIIDFDFEF